MMDITTLWFRFKFFKKIWKKLKSDKSWWLFLLLNSDSKFNQIRENSEVRQIMMAVLTLWFRFKIFYNLRKKWSQTSHDSHSDFWFRFKIFKIWEKKWGQTSHVGYSDHTYSDGSHFLQAMSKWPEHPKICHNFGQMMSNWPQTT